MTTETRFRFERWQPPLSGIESLGTIRTVPENYYVATVNNDYTLTFQDIETCTRDIRQNHQVEVWQWFEEETDLPKEIVWKTLDTGAPILHYGCTRR